MSRHGIRGDALTRAMNDYQARNSVNLRGEQLGLDWVKRVSVLPVEKAQPIEWHAHATIEILFCLKGVLVYEFGVGAPVTIKPGQFVVIPAGMRHRLSGGVDGPSKRGSLFIVRRIPLGSDATLPTREEYHQLIRALLTDPQRACNIPKQELAMVRSLCDRVIAHRLDYDLRVTLLYALMVFARQRPSIQAADDDVMPKCIEYLARHFAEQDVLAATIRYSGYGRSRFFQLFRQHTGKTPLEHLTEMRIDAVKARLAKPSVTVSAAARACGFGDLDFFRKVFKRLTGMTPTDYQATRR